MHHHLVSLCPFKICFSWPHPAKTLQVTCRVCHGSLLALISPAWCAWWCLWCLNGGDMASTTQYQWSHFQWFLQSLDLSLFVLIFWRQPFIAQVSCLQDPQDLWHVPSQVFQIPCPIDLWCLTWIAWEPPISSPLGFSFSPLPITWMLLPLLCCWWCPVLSFVARKVQHQENHCSNTLLWVLANHILSLLVSLAFEVFALWFSWHWLSQQQVVLVCHHLALLVCSLVWLPCSQEIT